MYYYYDYHYYLLLVSLFSGLTFSMSSFMKSWTKLLTNYLSPFPSSEAHQFLVYITVNCVGLSENCPSQNQALTLGIQLAALFREMGQACGRTHVTEGGLPTRVHSLALFPVCHLCFLLTVELISQLSAPATMPTACCCASTQL